jgi:uncharacterized paraquat-inducible protein A
MKKTRLVKDKLRQQAVKLLLDLGYDMEQIKTDRPYPVGKGWINIPAQADNGTCKTAVTTGDYNQDQEDLLKHLFDEVIHIARASNTPDGTTICFLCDHTWQRRTAYPLRCPRCKQRLRLKESSK